MRAKQIFKITVDICMTAALLLLMTYEMIDSAAHELTGMAMLVLFILHHFLNRCWLKNLFHGKYTAVRIVQTVLAVLILLAMIGSMVSGIILSRHVFAFLKITGGRSIARTVHMICAYWGFVLMSLHIGLHLNMLFAAAKRSDKSGRSALILKAMAALLSVYGIYAFFKRSIASYLVMKEHYVFFDMNEPIVLFLLDYIAVMCLFAVIGRVIVFIAAKKVGRKRQKD